MSIISFSKTYSGFDPRSIPGCQLWLDAADSRSFTLSGSTMTGWADKSGTSKVITVNSAPTYSSNGFNSSYPCFTFTSSNYLTIPLSSAVGTGDCMLVAVIKSTSTNNSKPLSIGQTGGPSEMAIGWNYIESLYKFYQYGSGESKNTSSGNNTNIILIGTRLSSTMSCFVNGNNPSSTGTNAYNNTNTTIYIGGGGFAFVGQLCEAILYVGTTTAAQRQQIEGYLARKWGLLTNLPATHPFKSFPLYTRPFQPTDIDGCQLWLDGMDPNGNGTIPSDGSAISTWVDKSGNSNSMTAVGTPTYALASKAVNLGGSAYFKNNLNASVFTVFFVYNQTSTVRPLFNVNFTTDVNGLFPNENGTTYFQRSDTQWYTQTSTLPRNTINNLAVQYDGASNAYIWLNGINNITTTTTGTITRTNLILGYRAFYGGEYFIANYHEVLYYNVALTSSQRQQIEGYLANKWGLKPNLPSTHPFKLVPSLTTAFHPLQISSCQLWLDGMDPNGNGTVPSDGALISTWVDKSGKGNSSTTTSGDNSPTYSLSTKALQFRSASTQSHSIAQVVGTSMANNTYTVYIVGTRKEAGAILISGSTIINNSNLFLAYNSSTEVIMGIYGESAFPNAAVPAYSASDPLRMITFNQYSASRDIYINGNFGSSYANSSTVLTSYPNPYIARSYTGANVRYWNWDANEILIFIGVLTASQRQQVEGYLAAKWGLRNNLPSTHPYKKFSP